MHVRERINAAGEKEIVLPNGEFVSTVYYERYKASLEQNWRLEQQERKRDNMEKHRKRQRRRAVILAKKRVARRAGLRGVLVGNPRLRGSAPGIVQTSGH